MPARATTQSKAPKAAKASTAKTAVKKAAAKAVKAPQPPKTRKAATPPKAAKSAAKTSPAKKTAASKPAARAAKAVTTGKAGKAASVPKTASKPAKTPAAKAATKAAAPSPSSVAKTRRAAKAPGQATATTPKPVTKAPTKPTPAAKVVVPPAAKKKRKPLPPGPLTEDSIRDMDDDDYMNEAQLAFFRERLLQMRQEVLVREVDVKERLHQREVFADPADRATAEEEHWLDLRLRERESLLLRKIDEALKRIADREYGYCEKTGDPIGIPRLLARPTATVCVDIKGQDERVEAQYRDR